MVENRCYGPFNTWAYGDAHPRVVARSWLGWWKGRVSYVPWSKHGIWVMVIHPRPRILRMGAKTPVKGLMGKQSGRIHVQSQSSCILALEERRDLVESCLHMAVLLEQRQNVRMWQILKLASNWPYPWFLVVHRFLVQTKTYSVSDHKVYVYLSRPCSSRTRKVGGFELAAVTPWCKMVLKKSLQASSFRYRKARQWVNSTQR